MICTLRRRPSVPTRVWAWVVAALLLVQAAVPLLAMAAAAQRGVDLVEICSVYGVRMVQADAGSPDSQPAPMPGQHAGGFDCALTPLLASAALPTLAAAVVLHAPPQAFAAPAVASRALPADASRRWLTGQLHAPPRSV